MSAPTPGPWEVYDQAKDEKDDGTEYPCFIRSLSPLADPNADWIAQDIDNRANARLIAAAPEMRAALDHPALLELLGAIEDSGSPEAARLFALVQAWDEVRGAAIAKAEVAK